MEINLIQALRDLLLSTGFATITLPAGHHAGRVLRAAVPGDRQGLRAAPADAHRLRDAAGQPARGGDDGAPHGGNRRGHGQGKDRCGRPAVVPLPGGEARDLPAADLPRRRGHDGLRPAHRQPQDAASGRRGPAGHLHHLHRGPLPRLQPAGGLLHRHHRRGRRPDGHLPHLEARPAPAGGHRRGGLLLHGTRPDHPAAHHAAADDEKDAHGGHGPAAARLEDRDGSSFPSPSP